MRGGCKVMSCMYMYTKVFKIPLTHQNGVEVDELLLFQINHDAYPMETADVDWDDDAVHLQQVG